MARSIDCRGSGEHPCPCREPPRPKAASCTRRGCPGRHRVAPALSITVGGSGLKRVVLRPPCCTWAPFEAHEVDAVIDRINARGYGVTFGLRHPDRRRCAAGHGPDQRSANAYVNRNQIGAIVGSQPLRRRGSVGTGAEAGGPQLPAPLPPCALAPHAGAEGPGPPRRDHRTASVRPFWPPGPRERAPCSTLPGSDRRIEQAHARGGGPFSALGPGPGAANAQAGAIRALGGIAVVAGGHSSARGPRAAARSRRSALVGSRREARAMDRVVWPPRGAHRAAGDHGPPIRDTSARTPRLHRHHRCGAANAQFWQRLRGRPTAPA